MTASLGPGARLGRYEIVRRLAVGGMAEIFLARAVGLDGFEKLVVLKTLLASPGEDEALVRMFMDEARLAARLHHAHVAQVFDVGREDGVHFIAMEHVHGADLRQVLARAAPGGGIPLEPALTIAAQVAAGLHFAHEARDEGGAPLGIVHRDVSPSNVLVSFAGDVKIVDFGVAKAASQRTATEAGVIKGKMGWMSPEQWRGETLDRRSDLFSLGLLLYEMTAGASPFPDETGPALARRLAEEDVPPPSMRRPGYPPRLEAIVRRALRRDRAARYPTARELQVDLEAFAQAEGLALSSVELGRFMEALFPAEATSPPAPAPPSSSRGARAPARRGRALGVVAAVALLAAGLHLATRRAGPETGRGVTAGAPRCGNGVLEPGEECDDGNTASDDGCTSRCLACPPGEDRFGWDENGHCYWRVSGPLSWGVAEWQCGKQGGHLVTYGSSREAEAVNDRLLRPAGGGWHWIGFTIFRRESHLGWITREPLAWKNWLPGEPGQETTSYVCAAQSADHAGPFAPGGWRAFSCGDALAFVCEARGWTVGPGARAYRLIHLSLAFDDAVQACAAQDAHLASVTSAEEHDFVVREFPGGIWLGATDRGEEGRFAWLTGEPFAFHRLAPGEPDDPDGTHDCLILGEDGLWHDRSCAQKHRPLCVRR